MNRDAPTDTSNNNMSDITTVILVDDHPVVRSALKYELEKEPDFKVIDEASDGEEAVKLVTKLQPDLVVMDIGLPKLNGIEATRQIKTVCFDTIVLVLTIFDDIEHVLGILESGADGYLTKNVLVEDIIKSMRSAVAGEVVLSPQVFKQVLKYSLRHVTKSMKLDTGVKLTIRELEVIRLVARGMSNKQIAEDLDLGARTVKSHLVGIFHKLDAFSRTEAVIIALRIGLLKIDDLA